MQRTIDTGIVFRAEGVGRAYGGAIQSLFDQAPEIFGFSEFDESTEGSVGIGGRSVEQHPRHRRFVVSLRVDTFPDTRRVVATFEGQFPNEKMGESM